jgi:hypothetical protein
MYPQEDLWLYVSLVCVVYIKIIIITYIRLYVLVTYVEHSTVPPNFQLKATVSRDLTKTSGVLSPRSYELKGLKPACDVINAFPKAARPQVSKNCCRPNVKNRVKVSTPATFRYQFMWLLAAFRNLSVISLAVRITVVSFFIETV